MHIDICRWPGACRRAGDPNRVPERANGEPRKKRRYGLQRMRKVIERTAAVSTEEMRRRQVARRCFLQPRRERVPEITVAKKITKEILIDS